MARIAGINIPNHQHTDIGLTAIFGIGRRARASSASLRVWRRTKKVKDLDDAEMESCATRSASSSSKATCAAKSTMNIKRLMDLGCYRGLRHRKGLPVRGQRTRTNARTRKGPQKAAASLKK